MARGGYRPGSGRPKGAKTSQSTEANRPVVPADVVAAANKSGISPLDYMLAVMRNPDADQSRRDRMAIAAAPFSHPRVSDNRFGKKDKAAQDAQNAGKDTEWADDLDVGFDETRPN